MKTKVMINRGKMAMSDLKKEIKNQGGSILGEYKNACLASIEKSKIKELKKKGCKVRSLKEKKEITFNGFKFNPQTSHFRSTNSLSETRTLSNGASHHLLRLLGPITKVWREKLIKTGVEFHEQSVANEFLISIKNSEIKKLSKLKFVESVSPYYPELKINQKLLTQKLQTELSNINGLSIVDIAEKKLKSKTRDVAKLSIDEMTANKMTNRDTKFEFILFNKKKLKSVSKKIQKIGGKVIEAHEHKLIVSIESKYLFQIASLPEIKAVNPTAEFKLFNNVAQGIINVDTIQNDLSLDGTGQIITVADTGLDKGVNDASLLADFRGRVVNIYALGRPSDPSDTDGHGTHVAGSVLGDGSNSNGTIQGMAPNSQLVFQSLLDAAGGLGGIPNDLGVGLFDVALADNSFIHTNSWGASVNGAYTANSGEADEFAFNNREFLILFAAGNDGNDPFGNGVVGIGTPGTAKNVLTVGASESIRALPTNATFPASPAFPSGAIIANISNDADNINHVAGFSSIGPAQNNRIKPDVVAPGTWILSTRSTVNVADLGPDGLSDTGDEDGVATHAEAVGRGLPGGPILGGAAENTPTVPAGSGANAPNNYMYDSGTSMATPILAGACSLVRQYLIQQRNHTPSSSLMKALIVNGAVPMGQNRNLEGWGRADLNNTIHPLGSGRVEFDDSLDKALETGDINTYNINVADPAQPMVITLVWRDPAGATIQNQLYLRVRHIATGNEFTAEVEGDPVLNNVQKVFIAAPAAGEYEIEVEALNITQGIPEFPGELKQDYALTISNGIGYSCNPTDVVQVIDRSGSMGFYGYMEPAKQRAQEFTDIMKINDQLGVVSFSGSSTPNSPVAFSLISSQIDKDNIKAQIQTISAGGSTDLREALEDGVATLGPDTGRPRAIIFLSDGRHTVSTQPISDSYLDSIAAQNIKVYTISLGPSSDLTVLNNIASRTGTGAAYSVDSPASLWQLNEIYYDILGELNCGSVIHLQSAPVFTSQVRTEEFYVNGDAAELRVLTSWVTAIKKVKVDLISPSGQEMGFRLPTLAFSSGDTYKAFKISNPEKGKWKVLITGQNANSLDKLTVGAIVNSQVKFELESKHYKNTLKLSLIAKDSDQIIPSLQGIVRIDFPKYSRKELLRLYRNELSEIKIDREDLNGSKDTNESMKLTLLAKLMAKKGVDIYEKEHVSKKLDYSKGTLFTKLDLKKLNFEGPATVRVELFGKSQSGHLQFKKLIPFVFPEKSKPEKILVKMRRETVAHQTKSISLLLCGAFGKNFYDPELTIDARLLQGHIKSKPLKFNYVPKGQFYAASLPKSFPSFLPIHINLEIRKGKRILKKSSHKL